MPEAGFWLDSWSPFRPTESLLLMEQDMKDEAGKSPWAGEIRAFKKDCIFQMAC